MSSRLTCALLVGLALAAGGCGEQPSPTPAHTPAPTATPSPTPPGGSPPAPREDTVLATTAEALAAAYEEDEQGAGAVYEGKLVVLTGVAFKVGDADGRQLLVLEGTGTRSVTCVGAEQSARAFPSFPTGGEHVRVRGRVVGAENGGNVSVEDCAVTAYGERVSGRTAKFPLMQNVLEGWGMFWFWVGFTVLGFLPLGWWRPASAWVAVPRLFFHLAASLVLYAFFGKLVLTYYNAAEEPWGMVLWPLFLLVNPS